jgi:hypothetical protein
MNQPRDMSLLERVKQVTPQPLHFIVEELWEKLPPDLFPLLEKRDGAARLCQKLVETFEPASIVTREGKPPPLKQRAWELVGLFYHNQGRNREAIPVFAALYDQMLAAEEETRGWFHKGMPLVWIADCYSDQGFRVLAERYLMMTLGEDAIASKGMVSADLTGIYFRLVWLYGLPDVDLQCYAVKMHELSVSYPRESIYPEWLLQQIDQNWLVELPGLQETMLYPANTRYIKWLLGRLGDKTGKTMELLADYLLSCVPGFRTRRRIASRSTDYDVICSMEGLYPDFRSELGRYFICECKDWDSSADFTTVAKFCRVLDSMKSRFGIIFSKNGISGKGKAQDAEGEQIKYFQDRGTAIVVVNKQDLEYLANGGNLVGLLREKYERIRLDLMEPKTNKSKTPAPTKRRIRK